MECRRASGAVGEAFNEAQSGQCISASLGGQSPRSQHAKPYAEPLEWPLGLFALCNRPFQRPARLILQSPPASLRSYTLILSFSYETPLYKCPLSAHLIYSMTMPFSSAEQLLSHLSEHCVGKDSKRPLQFA